MTAGLAGGGVAACSEPGDKKRGHYLGTEIDEKWWRRYLADGFFARGVGDYWIDDEALFFRRYLTKAPIVISLHDVIDIKLGKWHSGRWAGGAPIVKIVWKAADNLLSSGFVFSRGSRETNALVQELRAAVSRLATGRA